ncbi:LOW QUALITY PROTEIN: histone H1E-like [Uloborus diversus]|uniref:LOW QUALITY PROTEIN: histone H1E-like n=1 Tax=Uloborus diversus TaxID=327109 RepID=UPI0024097C08|nr:LOW QUALITY PROTEIN: histone H1E-like [Uloborus diversus]
MAETEAVATPAATPKKAKASKPKKPKTAPTHPKVSEMVNTAISTLKERGGSSVQAIKKYIGAHYKVDVDKLSPFIKKYLKNAVASGQLVQTKGKGASGSFRMTTATKEKTSKPKASAPKPKKASKPAAAKKVAKPKTPKKAAAKKPKAKAAKSPKKPKAVKPKSPKPKKAKAAKKPAAKKGKK